MQGGDELLSQQRVLEAPQRGRELGEALSGGGPGVEGRDLPGGRDRLPGQQRRLRFGSLRGDPPGFAQPLRGLGDVGVTDQQIGQERFKFRSLRGTGPAGQGRQQRFRGFLGAGGSRDDEQVGQVFVAQHRCAAGSQALQKRPFSAGEGSKEEVCAGTQLVVGNRQVEEQTPPVGTIAGTRRGLQACQAEL